jgi:hypothetical protein
MKKINALVWLASIVLTLQLQAQEQLGIQTSNFAGINGTILNPAAHSTTPFRWDINLVGGGLFIDNNYAFLRNTSIPYLLRNQDDINFVHGPDIDDERQMLDNEIVLDYFTDGRERFIQFNSQLMGPSFYVKIGENHAVGAYTRGRAEMSGKGIANGFSYYDYFDRPFYENFPVDDFQGTFMAWREIGINYMFQTPTNNGKIALGVTAKIVSPYEAAFFKSNNFAQVSKLPGDSLAASQVNLEYGFTTSNLDLDNIEPGSNGNGIAFDLGVVYTIGDEDSYDWKLGASILDIGKANFTSNAQYHTAVLDTTTIIGSDSYNSVDELMDLEELVQTFSQEILGDSSASLQSRAFGIGLPTAFSLQIDRAFTENIFLNATLVQSIPVSDIAIRRANTLALTPRFENRWFGASLPVVLHNWQDLRMGLSVKLGFLYLGTDNLGSLVGQSNLTGTDFYAALKINPFNLGLSKGGGGLKNKNRGRRGNVKCYDF